MDFMDIQNRCLFLQDTHLMCRGNPWIKKIGHKFPPLPVLAEAGNRINLLFEVEYKTLPVLRTVRWKWSEFICIR